MRFDLRGIPAFCLTLPRSADRRAQAEREFAKAGLRVEFVDGVDPQREPMPELCRKAPGAWGCAAAHARLMRRVTETGLAMACVFEDDVTFCDDFWPRVEHLCWEEDGADGYLLGGHFPGPNMCTQLVSPRRHVYQVRAAGGTYAYLFTRRVADFIARNWCYHQGADEFYSNEVYPRFKILAMVPFPCGSRPGRSDVTGASFHQYVNVDWYYQRAAFDLGGQPWRG